MQRFGLIGRTLVHSFSPAIHSQIADYEYKLYPLEPDRVAEFVQTTDLDGFNVTIPYKKDVIPLCKEISVRAKAIGSVNTMLRLPDGGWYGDNTDYDGFTYQLGKDAEALKGKKALVLGSGGSSQTVQKVLNDCEIPFIVVSRSGENNYENISRHADAELIVNTTPVGMYPHNGTSPVDLSLFPNCRLVLDLIYNPAKTALLLQAESLRIPARNGLSMLVAQGVRAGELFLNKQLPETLIETITDAIRRRTLNVVLIGMPGCGKTTVANLLSELTGRKTADTDDLIRAKAGTEIPEIFAKHGEPYFRTLEAEALREVSKESGLIIATGGGIVKIPANLDLIRQNSVCIFLDTDLSKLDTAGRPLSISTGVEQLYAERLPLYKKWSDKTYHCEDLAQTAAQIKTDLSF
ncbi:MAG TPA: shikimate kinase [Oscillospiraceae bacterium]|mgnify:CR=1 FL=1|nr:shikimate kinase [Oscillospiraceae bacterium]HPF56794.1 shikimate kinase [Clostridiales bacterium]HPK35972.1 shikimate kinase [Oscillospiraceae bacterium]HPR76243.1 shikimate kinase [Oscillospiraceae bacterium]